MSPAIPPQHRRGTPRRQLRSNPCPVALGEICENGNVVWDKRVGTGKESGIFVPLPRSAR
ncbi:hypothetical protein Csa_011862 [Cucumis sativus]|uniref:Uncharacterized protein n=1 Tax=Cucumis sativus TaxID=3659 RepID=A0A0A0K6Y2_CUCSA|nr:hypothetical protein Csa_011862 [Cucumis sativus]